MRVGWSNPWYNKSASGVVATLHSPELSLPDRVHRSYRVHYETSSVCAPCDSRPSGPLNLGAGDKTPALSTSQISVIVISFRLIKPPQYGDPSGAGGGVPCQAWFGA